MRARLGAMHFGQNTDTMNLLTLQVLPWQRAV